MAIINKLIESVARCTICGAKYGQCVCWQDCECGWMRRRGELCNNPKHKHRAPPKKTRRTR